MARKYRHFVYDENQRFIYPTSDWGFKYLFGSERNKDLLLGILQELLPELGIENLDYIPRDLTIPVGKMKDASFDVHCKLKDGSRAVIEMQNYARKTFLDRAVIYTSAAVLENFVNSDINSYRIGKTIFISFVGDPLFSDTERTPVRLSMCDIDEPRTTVRNDRILQIFIELPKFAGDLEGINEDTPFIEKLAYVLMEMADCNDIPSNLCNPLLEKLFRAADTSRMKQSTKKDYMKAIIGETDYEFNLADARDEGWEEGLAEGRAEGRAEGAKSSKVEVGTKLKAKGFDDSTISEITGLTISEIQSL